MMVDDRQTNFIILKHRPKLADAFLTLRIKHDQVGYLLHIDMVRGGQI